MEVMIRLEVGRKELTLGQQLHYEGPASSGQMSVKGIRSRNQHANFDYSMNGGQA